MRFVCFIGIDGSGKTTHAKFLVKSLSDNKYPSLYVRAAHRPVFSYFFYAFTRILGFWKFTEEGKFTDPLQFASKNIRTKLNPIWLLSLYLDFQALALIKVHLPLLFGKIVVCDRYVYDLITELILSKQYTDRFGKLLLRTLPMPEITFFMDTPEKIAKIRHGCDLEYLSSRRKIYSKLANKLVFSVVNSVDSFGDNSGKIWHQVTHITE